MTSQYHARQAAASILRLLRDATELPAYPADAVRKIRRHQLKSFFATQLISVAGY
jgi:hypothetical protein